MKRKSQKAPYPKVRLPRIVKIGGTHQPVKGGKYSRGKEKQKALREIKHEFEYTSDF